MVKVRWRCLLVLMLGWVSPAQAQKTPEQFQVWWQPTLVHLTSGYQGQWRWQERTWTTVAVNRGTGFFVHPNGQILTLASVVRATARGDEFGQRLLLEDLARQRLQLHNQTFPNQRIPLTPPNIQEAVTIARQSAQLEQFERINEVFLAGGRADQAYGFQVIKNNPQSNLALVRVQLTQTPTLVLGTANPPRVGTTLYALAQPDPQVTHAPELTTGTWNQQGMGFANPRPLAGSIVFLPSGELLGLAAPEGNQVTLVGAKTIRQFLQTAGVENQDSPVNALWQEALGHFWQAHYRRAQPVLQSVIDRYPQHHTAQTLLTQAQERIDQGQDRSPGAWWLVGLAVGGLGLLTLGAVGFALWFSRRPRPVPPVQPIPTAPPPQGGNLTVPLAEWDMNATVVSPPVIETPPPDLPEPPTRVLEPPSAPVTQVSFPVSHPPRPAPVAATEEYRPSRLVGIAGPTKGEEFTLVGSHHLGRDSQRCQIVIPDPQVSGQHAWIEVTETHVTLRDCGSTNGTFINDVLHPRITQVRLQDQDVIILGQKGTVKFRFHA